MEFREEKKRIATTLDGDVITIAPYNTEDERVYVTLNADMNETVGITVGLEQSEALGFANELTNGRLKALVKAVRAYRKSIYIIQKPTKEAEALVEAGDAFAGEFEP